MPDNATADPTLASEHLLSSSAMTEEASPAPLDRSEPPRPVEEISLQESLPIANAPLPFSTDLFFQHLQEQLHRLKAFAEKNRIGLPFDDQSNILHEFSVAAQTLADSGDSERRAGGGQSLQQLVCGPEEREPPDATVSTDEVTVGVVEKDQLQQMENEREDLVVIETELEDQKKAEVDEVVPSVLPVDMLSERQETEGKDMEAFLSGLDKGAESYGQSTNTQLGQVCAALGCPGCVLVFSILSIIFFAGFVQNRGALWIVVLVCSGIECLLSFCFCVGCGYRAMRILRRHGVKLWNDYGIEPYEYISLLPFVFVLVLCVLAVMVGSSVLGSSSSLGLTSRVICWIVFVSAWAPLSVLVYSSFQSVWMTVLCCMRREDEEACMQSCYKANACVLLVISCGCLTRCLETQFLSQKQRPCTKEAAKKFVYNYLHIDQEWFDEVECGCKRCWRSGEESCTQGGKAYSSSKDWVRFGLPPVRGFRVRGMDTWHVAYHGTSGLSAKAIIESQRFLMPGDRRPDGGYIEIQKGHLQEEGFAKNVFLSPSITYVSAPCYCIERGFGYQHTKYRVLVALEVIIKPETYEVGPETIGAQARGIAIDSVIPNDELEWFTNRRGVTDVAALLVKLDHVETVSSSDSKYEGDLKDGLMHGKGVLHYTFGGGQ